MTASSHYFFTHKKVKPEVILVNQWSWSFLKPEVPNSRTIKVDFGDIQRKKLQKGVNAREVQPVDRP